MLLHRIRNASLAWRELVQLAACCVVRFSAEGRAIGPLARYMASTTTAMRPSGYCHPGRLPPIGFGARPWRASAACATRRTPMY